jgi:hypothetical protein
MWEWRAWVLDVLDVKELTVRDALELEVCTSLSVGRISK